MLPHLQQQTRMVFIRIVEKQACKNLDRAEQPQICLARLMTVNKASPNLVRCSYTAATQRHKNTHNVPVGNKLGELVCVFSRALSFGSNHTKCKDSPNSKSRTCPVQRQRHHLNVLLTGVRRAQTLFGANGAYKSECPTGQSIHLHIMVCGKSYLELYTHALTHSLNPCTHLLCTVFRNSWHPCRHPMCTVFHNPCSHQCSFPVQDCHL